MTTPQTDLTALLSGVIANAEAFERDVHLDIADAKALLAALAGAETPQGMDDGSVMVRVDPAYVSQMRGDGLAGPFSRIQLDERNGVPTLLLTVQPTPTPDTVEYWRSVAQELATEIHKLRGMTAPMEPR